jgi:hypothetical protein
LVVPGASALMSTNIGSLLKFGSGQLGRARKREHRRPLKGDTNATYFSDWAERQNVCGVDERMIEEFVST